MKKLIIMFGLFIVGIVQTALAQDTITVELSSKAKIVIYTKDREGLDLVRKLDLNQIIRQTTAHLDTQNVVKNHDNKVYEYDFNTNNRSLNLRRETRLDEPDTMVVYNNNQNDTYRYRSRRRTRLFWAVDLGLNNYLENGGFPKDNAGYALGSPIQSRYLSVGTYQRSRIGGTKSPFYFQTGLELNWYNFVFQDNNYIVRGDNGVEFRDYEVDKGKGLSKSKLTVTYLTIPANISIRLRDKYGRLGFVLGGGAYISYRLDAYAKQKFDRDPERQRGNFALNNWRYGWEAQAGYRNFLLFFRTDLSTLFQEGQAPQLHPFTLGVRI
jgi:hypothetical protein